MATVVPGTELTALLGELQAIAADAERSFGALTAERINWRPSPEQWSIGQCFDHLITTNRCYYPAIEKAIAGDRRRTVWERLPVLPGFFGTFLLKSIQPGSGKKFKAPPIFKPASSDVDGKVIEEFVAHQSELMGLIRKTAGLDLDKIIVTSPVAVYVTYSLMDAYRVLTAHEKRHFLQAQRLLARSDF